MCVWCGEEVIGIKQNNKEVTGFYTGRRQGEGESGGIIDFV